MADSFILGLSSGSACLLTCGMVLFPYFMSGSAGVKKIAAGLTVFMIARFLVYFLLATLAWFFGQAIFAYAVMRNAVPGILYIVFAVMLVWYSIRRNRRTECPAKIVTAINNKKLIPIFLGVVNSLGFCPALLILLTKGAIQSSIAQSYMSFLAFFIGSSLWFIPLPLTGRIRKKQVFETIGILATGLAGTIFLIKGITIIIGGLINE